MAPMYVAEDQGFFKAEGITNKYEQVPDAYAAAGLQSQGKLDVNMLGISAAFFNAINSGLKIKAVADRLQYTCSSDNELIVRTKLWNEGHQTIAGLKGSTVALLSRGSATEYWLDVLLAQQGLTEKDLGKIVTLSYPNILTGLKTGAVDYTFLAQPLGAQALDDGTAKRIQPIYKIVPNEEIGILDFSDSFIGKDSGGVAARWLAAWLKGVRYFEDTANKQQVIATVAKWTKIDPKYISQLYGTDQWPWMRPNGDVDLSPVAADANFMKQQNLVKSIPAVSDWYDSGPINAAVKLVGSVAQTRDCSSVPAFSVQ